MKLTAKELVCLGYDQTTEPVRASIRANQELTDEQREAVVWDAKYLPSSGESDPSEVRTANRIRRKLEELD